ncbi:MAG: hypothetical protein NTW16_18280 [Bacteroidetes bacterium]|nr:hypothetical protein [Bacteroidota bacterium]
MMKKFYVIFLLVIISVSGKLYSQLPLPYYDAIKLSTMTLTPASGILDQGDDAVYQILEKYVPPSARNDKNKIREYFNPATAGKPDPNPFIEISGSKHSGNKNFFSSGSKQVFSSLGSVDVTKYAQGVSLFLIDRAKQELNIAFFQKFKKFVEKNPEIGILFPNTTNSLGNILAYQYSQMLPVLQEAFYQDMEILPANLVEVLLMDKYYNKVKNFPEFIVIIRSVALLQQIDFLSPPEILDKLPEIADVDSMPQLRNLYSSLKLVAIFSNSIRTDSAHYTEAQTNYWVSSKEFYDNILNKPIVLNLFLGLVYQQIKNDSLGFNKTLLADQISNNSQQILWYNLQFTKLLTQVNQINAAARSIKLLKENGEKPTSQDICTYVSAAIDLFDFGYDMITHYNPGIKTMDIYIELARNANSLYIHAISQKYALAMNNAIHIFSTFNKNPGNNKVFNENFITGINTYGTFIANVAGADTPQEVQAAIETAALPAGSSSMKKNYSNNIALNAYLGVNAGNWPKDKSNSMTWNGNFRLTAPIGIAWTPFSFGKGGALSVFASILDIGAIVDYQLNGGSPGDSANPEVTQKIYLANIFSPGGYLVYGMAWNLPVSVGFGGQYGPGMIKMGNDLWNPTWRWNFFIAVDIPVFNFRKGKGIVLQN